MRHLGGPLNTLIGAPLRRRRLLKVINDSHTEKPDDITIMIGIKNRVNYRLANSLKSLRSQTYPNNLIKIIVVDYENDEENSAKLKKICALHDAKILRVNNRPVWNKSHCFNVAIKHTTTKFLMSNDADMIMSSNFIESVVNTLKSNPLSLVLAEMRDLPEAMESTLKKYAEENSVPDIEFLKANTKVRKTHTQLGKENENAHISILATYTFFYHCIHGYDEFYELWGAEDNDMFRRFYYFGLTPKNINDRAFYMHQWHQQFEGLQKDNIKATIKRNQDYYYNNHSIVRNKDSWGKLPAEETSCTNR